MKGLIGLILLIMFNAAGMWLHSTLHLPLPGNVLGLLLFLAALWCRVIRLEWVELAAQYLLKHMLLFFIPFVVGIMAFFPLLGENWLSIGVGVIGSTIAVLFVTGYVVKRTQVEVPNNSNTIESLHSKGETV